MAEARLPILTMTTDFGTADSFVAEMKGVILSQTTHLHLVDASHEIPAHDIAVAAWFVRAISAVYPPRTVHLVVVDPGVGTERRPIAVSSAGQYFVGPDNGVFTLLYEPDVFSAAVHITAQHYFARGEPSPTFHGRDIFAPVAAQIARGISLESFGEPIQDMVKVELPRPRVTPEGNLRASVIRIDRFGNLILNVTRDAVQALMQRLGRTQIRGGAANVAITELRTTYGDGPAGSPFFLYNSGGFLEVATYRARASELLKLKVGDTLDVNLV